MMNINSIFLLLIASLLSFLPLYADEPDAEIRIGIITDLTGLAAYWGRQTVLGAKLAQDEFDQQGMPVKITIEDHGLETKRAITAAQKLLFIDKVDALYSEFAMTTVAASPLAKNAQKLFMGDCAANSFLSSNPYAFKTYINYSLGCKAVAEQWKKQGIKKAALLKAETEYGSLCLDGLQEVFPDAEIVEYKYGEAVRTQAMVLKSKAVEAVLNASFEGDIMNMLEAFQTIDFAPHIASNFDALTDNVIRKYPKYSKKYTTFGFGAIAEDFIQRIKAVDPENNLVSIEAAALAYFHLKQFANVLKSCDRKDVQCHVDTLSSQKDPYAPISGFQGYIKREAIFSPLLNVHYTAVK